MKILSVKLPLLYFVLIFLNQDFFWCPANLKGATSYKWLTIKVLEVLALFCFRPGRKEK